jgi:hypothetical protein
MKEIGTGTQGIPAVYILSPTRLRIETSNRNFLSDLDSNIALQIISVLGSFHSHNMCILNLEAGEDTLEHLQQIFSINDDSDAVTLVDFSFLRRCPDSGDHEAEDLMAMEALIPIPR